MDKPGDWQVSEGSGEQGKMEETGSKIICGAPTTLTLKRLMMMMIFIQFAAIHYPKQISVKPEVYISKTPHPSYSFPVSFRHNETPSCL